MGAESSGLIRERQNKEKRLRDIFENGTLVPPSFPLTTHHPQYPLTLLRDSSNNPFTRTFSDTSKLSYLKQEVSFSSTTIDESNATVYAKVRLDSPSTGTIGVIKLANPPSAENENSVSGIDANLKLTNNNDDNNTPAALNVTCVLAPHHNITLFGKFHSDRALSVVGVNARVLDGVDCGGCLSVPAPFDNVNKSEVERWIVCTPPSHPSLTVAYTDRNYMRKIGVKYSFDDGGLGLTHPTDATANKPLQLSMTHDLRGAGKLSTTLSKEFTFERIVSNVFEGRAKRIRNSARFVVGLDCFGVFNNGSGGGGGNGSGSRNSVNATAFIQLNRNLALKSHMDSNSGLTVAGIVKLWNPNVLVSVIQTIPRGGGGKSGSLGFGVQFESENSSGAGGGSNSSLSYPKKSVDSEGGEVVSVTEVDVTRVERKERGEVAFRL